LPVDGTRGRADGAKEQEEYNGKITQQLEAAYQKVQDIAVKTVEGASDAKSLANLQQFLGDRIRKGGPDKGG
jgi:hypothetical protein